ncbi:glycosyltransferase [Cytophagaceae bacterium ABcell3]|nr:glycosyltransferase [Cytophagaceae bacterium ABcell3]
MKKLSIVIVNYNVRHFLEQTLHSVFNALHNIDAEVFVVDNNSVDGSVDMVRKLFPQVKLIANKHNSGFSKANNQAIRQATGEYILLLNPDTIVQEDTFRKCIDFMDAHPEGGGLGVKMLDGQGRFLPESKRGLPSPEVAFYKIFGLAALFPKSKRFGKYHLGYLDENQTHEVDILSGAYMFLRKETLDKIGLLEEEYFMYGEDIDLSWRIILGGYKNYYFPETRIIHYKGESTKKTSINYVFIFYKAMIIFASKYFSSRNAKLFSFLIHSAIYFRASLSIIKRFIDKTIIPIADFTVTLGGFYLLKNFWEINYKQQPNYFPEELMLYAAPLYCLIWQGSTYFTGGYKRGSSLFKIFQGVIIGTIIISAFSNFFDSYRFSRALILLGSVWGFAAMAGIRMLAHYKTYRNFRIGETGKNILLIGSETESIRIIERIKETRPAWNITGFISPGPEDVKNDLCLGTVQQIEEIIDIHKINEILFCSKDLPAHQIIELMSGIDVRNLQFKIIPGESNYIIGSSSRDTQGDFFTLNLELNISSKVNLRKKRFLDLGISCVLLVFSPIIMWFFNKPLKFIGNIFSVFSGKYSWVGYEGTGDRTLPTIKKGIISPASVLPPHKRDLNTIGNVNFDYARNYNPLTDLLLIIKSFWKLGV